MNLEDLYCYAARSKIDVLHIHLPNKKIFCFDDLNSMRIIGIDLRKMENFRETKCFLAEEICHLEGNLTYHLSDSKNPNWLSNVRQCETRARCKAAVMQVPLEDLQKALLQTTDVWALADILDVKESVVVDAVDYYKRKGLLQ